MMSSGGSTALQKAVGAYSRKKRDSRFESSTPTPLSGIGLWTQMGEDNLQKGLIDPMYGNLEVNQGAQLGGKFSRQGSNPWEAFMATPAEQEAESSVQGGLFSNAYSPKARGINMKFY